MVPLSEHTLVPYRWQHSIRRRWIAWPWDRLLGGNDNKLVRCRCVGVHAVSSRLSRPACAWGACSGRPQAAGAAACAAPQLKGAGSAHGGTMQ